MFKKPLLLIILSVFIISGAYADELDDVQTFFESYVDAANSYSKTVTNYYLPGAKIIRVVEKPDGTTQSVNFSMDRYKTELKKGQKLARLAKYKNKYTDRKFTKLENGDYKISAQRTPSKGTESYPFYFIITNTDDGWKVKEESMHTPVQKFLSAK